MQLLDGKLVSAAYKEQIKQEVDKRKAEGKKAPHLAAILIGDNPASKAYVGNKVKTCGQLGFDSTLIDHDDISEEDLLAKIDELNKNDDVDGILVQLPLPDHINEKKVIESIDVKKDVDGFHPSNLGRMMIGQETFIPATPYGILLMLEHYSIDTKGKHCVVIGRSNIVGTPMSVLLSRNSNPGNCTVTLTHRYTENLKDICVQADIVVVAVGIPRFITADMIKEGATVVDVGINRIPDDTRKSGSRLVGDVDFENVKEKCEFITPVPGGVGLMTICALMKNTLRAVDL